MNLSKYFWIINIILTVLIVGLLLFGDIVLFTVSYIGVFFFAAVRTLMSAAKKRMKFYMLLAYLAIMIIQIVAGVQVVFIENTDPEIAQFLRRLFGVAILFLPVVISRYVSAGKYAVFYLPSVQEAATISFSELHSRLNSVRRTAGVLQQAGKSVSPENLRTVLDDLPRHDSFRYINDGSLTQAYFSEAKKTLDDPNIYIVISNTGSAASEIISVFTQKQYNHASLSFDRELRTIISYNGGERVYPPGLNHEMIDFFNKKDDASILVYSLPCALEQKRAILDTVEAINREGSAYNMVGLLLKYSHKPNIMFCSQFVYKMLQSVGLEYFTKPDGKIRPTDLIELDYHKKLKFEYDIRLN